MSRLRILYISLLVILGVLLVFTVFRPMAVGRKYSELQRGQLLQTKDGWIIQFDIINREGKDINYTINASVDGQPSTLITTIQNEGVFTYIKHIKRDMLTGGVVSLTVYKEGDETPLEQATYHLK